MAENIEFKAKVSGYGEMKAAMQRITGAEPILLDQTDVFYNCKKRRVKLRTICGSRHELIIYNRKNVSGPKLSKYIRIRVKHFNLVNKFLASLFGTRGTVRKRRTVFLKDNIRFHLDRVEGLGDFMEIEYVLSPTESRENALKEVNVLLQALDIRAEMLIECAYIDLLQKKDDAQAPVL